MMHSDPEVWELRGEADPERLEEGRCIGLSVAASEIAARRSLGSLAAFMRPRLADLPSPDLLPDMEVGAARLADAVQGGESVVIFGDYDADGCTAAAVLSRFLGEVGCVAKVRLPHRLKDGYGLSKVMVERLAPEADLLITVDCGATSFAALERAGELDLDVIVCDHHTVADTIPPAVAVINPKRPDSAYPPGEPAAVGVAWNLAVWTRRVLRQRGAFEGRTEPDIEALLALVAVGTVADMVPLTGANRVFVRRGLEALDSSPFAGLKVLRAHIKGAELTERSIGFDIAPRLNAAGRLADADLAWRILVTDDHAEAAALFTQLDEINVDRRALQKKTVDEVMARVRRSSAVPDCIVAYDPEWHPGVVGLAAGRLVDRYNRAAVVIGQGGKGSARAPAQVHLVQALKQVEAHLVAFGGHSVAAGLTLAKDADIGQLRAGLNLAVRAQLGAEGHRHVRVYDAELAPWLATLDLARELRALAPFGQGNPVPVLLGRRLQVRSRRDYKSDFTRIAVAAPVDSGQVWLDGFRMGRVADRGQSIDVLYEVEPDHFNEKWRARRRVIALREAR